MASPPRIRRINPPDDPATGFVDALPQLNSHMEMVTDALDAKLTRSQNILSQKKVLIIRTSDLPITFDCTMGVQPEHIACGQSSVVSPITEVFAGAVDVSQWLLMPGNKIKYTSIPGLKDGVQYSLTLIIT